MKSGRSFFLVKMSQKVLIFFALITACLSQSSINNLKHYQYYDHMIPKTDPPAPQQDPTYHYNMPSYIDKSGLCPKLYYAAYRIIQNCSSLNLASNWPVQAIDQKFVTELLLLNNSFLSTLPYMQINNYYHLKLLDLSYNFISESTTDLKLIDCGSNDLSEINLNYNLFRVFPLFGLNCTSQLDTLRLRYNEITNIDGTISSFYPQMQNLKLLDLAHNNIQSLNANQMTILQKFPNLIFLNLMSNKIKFIQENPFSYIPNLSYLNIEGNQIQCEMRLRWLKKYLRAKFNPPLLTGGAARHHHEKYYAVQGAIQSINDNGTKLMEPYFPTCFSIFNQRNESIIYLDDWEFYTPIYLSSSIQSPNALSVSSGQKLDLDCSVYSQPPADLWWSFNDKILSKTVSPDSPYEFIEDFNSMYNQTSTNKSSVLRIKKAYQQLSGMYSCQAYYLNKGLILNPQSIAKIMFKVNVAPSNDGNSGSLSAGALAGIIIGAVLGFLLLCCLLFLCIYCCCFKRGLCCFGSSMSSGASSSSSSALYNKKKSNAYLSKTAEIEEKASGFKDLHRTKPNYVINTISKSTSKLTTVGTGGNSTPPSSSRRRMIPVESSGSWCILPNSNSNLVDENEDMNQDTLKKYDDTQIYNLNKATITAASAANTNSTSTNLVASSTADLNNYQNQHRIDQSQIYTIRHPVEYVSTTNEAYLAENNSTSNDFNTINNLRLSNLSELNNVNSNNYYNSSMNPPASHSNSNQTNNNNFYTVNDDYLNDDSHFLDQNRINNHLVHQHHHVDQMGTYGQQTHYHKSFKKQYSSNNFEVVNTNPNAISNSKNNNNNNSFAKYDSDV